MTTIPFVQHIDTRAFVVGREPMVFHCHHYNTFLQRTIRDASYVRSGPYLVGAAAEVAFNQLGEVFRETGLIDPGERMELAEELYRWAGFGIAPFDELDASGGTVSTRHSHYAAAWKAKFGAADFPVCHFTSGWLAGALAAIYDRAPDTYSVRHDACRATGAGACKFALRDDGANHRVFTSVGPGSPSGDHDLRPVPAHNVDYEAIYGALSSTQVVGDQAGSIPIFGVYLTRHYANYANRITFETERALGDMFGRDGVLAAEPMFTEAGQVCAFHTLGGLMTSTEWDRLVRPSLQTREDWVHGIVAAINTLGWGRWQVTEVSERGATFVIHDDYESVGYLAMYGQSDHPVAYLAAGAAAGIMNLVYRGDLSTRPRFTEPYYDGLFRAADSFTARALESKAMGDAVTAVRVEPA